MTHFCSFGTVTPVIIIGFGSFFLIDRSRSQAALMQVSSTLLNSDSKKRVKCENIFVCDCGKSQVTMTHPLATMTHILKALKTVRLP